VSYEERDSGVGSRQNNWEEMARKELATIYEYRFPVEHNIPIISLTFHCA
jgi:hypothetical protein